MTEEEQRNRLALGWALKKTPIRIPAEISDPLAWKWDADDVSLSAEAEGARFDFHVALEVRGSRRVRVATLGVGNADFGACWEADMPAGMDSPVVRS